MKKFDTILNGYYRLLSEQDPGMGAAAPVNPAVAGNPLAAPPPAGPAPVSSPVENPEEPEEPEVQPLSPESEVLLVQFIRKALLLDISLNDKSKLLSLMPGDEVINETNAKDMLQALIEIIKGYTVEDIDTSKDKIQLNTPV